MVLFFRYFHCNLFKEKSQMVSFVDPDVVQLVKMCAGVVCS